MDAMIETKPARGLAPFSLKDAPALIERVFPAQKVGIEAQKERKAGAGQTLTALGSYWKGRKPLVLVRACVLASLLPATDDPTADIELFEMLMRMDPEGISRRKANITAQHVLDCRFVSDELKTRHVIREDAEGRLAPSTWRRFQIDPTATKALSDADRARFDEEREDIRQRALAAIPFSEQVGISERVEKLEDLRAPGDALYAGVMDRANARFRTDARTLPELVEQLGIARFGHRPTVGDPFAGGGSIPFEAARVGCDVVASDLNPIAAMLTWGALNIIGADKTRHAEIAAEQERVAAAVDAEIVKLGIEHNKRGDRAKAYLYCLEIVDPQTGWRIPMAPSWVISWNRRCVAKMIPVHAEKRFDLEVLEDASATDMAAGERGTVRDGHLIYRLAPQPGVEEQDFRVSISSLRGDGEGSELSDGSRGNRLRRWTISDVAPREPRWVADATPVLSDADRGAWIGGDIWLERLYCIQWVDGADIAAGKSRPRAFFASPDADDLAREDAVRELVESNLSRWQDEGFVPDMPIEAGAKTDEPIRTRGWTHWQHLFTPRQILLLRTFRHASGSSSTASFANVLDYNSRLCRWATKPARETSGSGDYTVNTFYNQAFNTNYNYASRASSWSTRDFANFLRSDALSFSGISASITTGPVAAVTSKADLWIYDPPYADAVHYHEITEFFIAWLRKSPPAPFDQWAWDSRRPLAIKGKGEKFRTDMVDAFRAMANRMPDNGLQVCMFTHQDAGVWADMAGIVWGAGLRVTAAWYVSTETTSELKKGGYVQGTVLLVLRKRLEDKRAYKDELVVEVRESVTRQVALLTGMNQNAKAHQRDENPFSDADIQMAGYAAALEVLTGYTHVEGVDMTREALRPRVKGEKGIVEEMIDLAVQAAVEMMRPDGLATSLWEKLAPIERFWLKMTEAEATAPVGAVGGKVDAYQNFAKAYRADGWEDLMADRTANRARLKSAVEFKRAMMSGHPFSAGPVRPVLFAIADLQGAAEREEDHGAAADRALAGLRDNLAPWAQRRHQALAVADWLGRTVERIRSGEASAARTLAALIRSERLS